MEAGGESQGDGPEFVDPFDTGRDGEGDVGEVEVVDVSEEKSLPPLMRASDLLPKAEPVEDDGDEVPPTPEEAELQSLPLAQREQLKLSRMTPEQRARYDAAQAEIMSMPAVSAFAAEEDRVRASKEATSKAFIEAYRKKQKEKT
jgi:hypothetical protein